MIIDSVPVFARFIDNFGTACQSLPIKVVEKPYRLTALVRIYQTLIVRQLPRIQVQYREY